MNERELALLEHELKTPLAVIVGYAELLAARDDEETRLAAADQIGVAARRLTDSVDALLARLAAAG